MVRYQGQAAMARLTVPFAREKPFDFPVPEHHRRQGRRQVARAGAGSLAALHRRRVPPPRHARRDRHHARRPTRSRTFIADDDPDKRTKLVDRLLDRPEYVDYWTLKWGDVLRVNSDKLGAQGMLAFNLWLREAFRANMPVNRMVEELVTAQGSIFSNGPANFFRVASSPDDLAETTAQVFMGVRLQCAKCHHHPFEAYGQDDYYAPGRLFRPGADQAERRVRPLRRRAGGLCRQGRAKSISRGPARRWRRGRWAVHPVDDPVDRRRALAKWLTSRESAAGWPATSSTATGAT